MTADIFAGIGDIERLPAADISQRATSFWDSAPLQAACIYMPRSTQDVSRLLAACNAAGQTVVIQSGRTGCAGGAVSQSSDVVISLEKMNRIEQVDFVGQTVVVQAGVILQTLQEAVAEHDLFFPLDLGARGSCMIGGNIATNAGGVSVIRYGMVRNLVLGLEAVLADGRIISSMKPMLKDNSGYDLKQLFIGTEGTLGVVTRAVLRLEPAVNGHATALLALETFENVLELLGRAKAMLRSQLVSFELMWGDYYRAVTRGHGLMPPVEDTFGFYVLIEVETTGADDTAFISLLAQTMEEGLTPDGTIAQSEADRRLFWRIRDDFEPILQSRPVYLFDVSMAARQMKDYVEQVRARVTRLSDQAQLHVFGHIGDGNLHLFVHPGDDPSEKMRRAVEACVYEPLGSVAGSISAEHGVGQEKKPWLPVSRTAEEIALMKTLKHALDPKNILNPGVIFDL